VGKGRNLAFLSFVNSSNLLWTPGHHEAPRSPKEQIDSQASLLLDDTRRSTFFISLSSWSTHSMNERSSAKTFRRRLASFALVRSSHAHRLTSHVTVVNKEGDLELYAVHHAPKQAMSSTCRDLIISASESCRVIEGFPESSLLSSGRIPHPSQSRTVA
jgi:hypothetical protein